MKRKKFFFSFADQVWTRPGFVRLHTFRSKVVQMRSWNDIILVILENGKAYYSNSKMARWYLIK